MVNRATVVFFLVAMLWAVSPASAARVDAATIAAATGGGVLQVGPTPSVFGANIVTVTSQVWNNAGIYTYIYHLTNYTHPGSPLGFLNVTGSNWLAGSPVLNWGQIASGTSGTGALLLTHPLFSATAMVAAFGTTPAGPPWPVGGITTGSTLMFYVQSLRGPALFSATTINGGVNSGLAYAPTPEPGTLALIGAGLVGLYGAVRRRQQRRA